MIDVTVIGCGFMGENHARAVAEHPGMELASVVDVDEERAETVADEYGANAALTGYEDALADAEAAIVATPEQFHAEQADAAFDRDVHLLLEKPITADLSVAARLAERERERERAADYVTGVSFVLRYDPAYATAQTAARNGDLGDLVAARVKRGITTQESRRVGGRGHPLYYMSIHDIDAILAATDQSVTSVAGFERRGELTDVDVPDATQAVLQFDDGLIATVEGYGVLPNDTPGMIDAAFELVGSAGTATVDTPGNAIELHADGFDRPDTRHWPVVNDRVDGAVARQVARFADAITGGDAMLASIHDGYRAQAIAESIREAIAAETVRSVNDPGPNA